MNNDHKPCMSHQLQYFQAKKLALDNKTLAKIKLRSKELSGALDASIGPTWFASLQKEFEKPYFAELSRFLERERASQTIYPPSNQVSTFF